MVLLANTLTIHQLRLYAKKWLKETYDMELTVPLNLNGRLAKTCGKFVYTKFHDGKASIPKKIDMNKFFVENNKPELVLDVLRHELVHYVLFMKDMPFSDGDRVFEMELKKLGIVSQSTINKYKIESKPKSVNIYKCANVKCGTVHQRQRALKNDGRFHSCSCGGKLQNLGKRMVSA